MKEFTENFKINSRAELQECNKQVYNFLLKNKKELLDKYLPSSKKPRTLTKSDRAKKLKFHEILAEKLDGVNITQTANELGIAPSVLFDWVKGRRSPRLDHAITIKKLADRLGIDFEVLFFGDKTNTDTKKIVSITSFIGEDGEKYTVQVVKC